MSGLSSFTALWRGDQHSLELRGDSFDTVDEYRAVAATVRSVDVDMWLSALPESVIKPDARAASVEEILADIPVPDSVDVAAPESGQQVSDRYQLGKGHWCRCMWMDRSMGPCRSYRQRRPSSRSR